MTTPGRMRTDLPRVSPALAGQILVIDLERERVECLHREGPAGPNVFFTRSPQKALLWSQLEPLDLILMRFGEPLDAALDLLQALIDANPAPPVLLLVEPGAERVADRLVHRGICFMQPISIAPDELLQRVRQLLNPHAPDARHAATVRPPQPDRQAGGAGQAGPPAAPPPPELMATSRPATRQTATPPPVAAPVWELPFLDQLVIELAHRLKNPLVSIKTFTHLLRERFNDGEFRERFYAIVGNDVVQLNDVVDRLLEFTEFTRPYPKPLQPAAEVRQAVEAVDAALQAKQLTVQIETAPGRPTGANGDTDGITARPPTGQQDPPSFAADPMQFRYLLKQLLLDGAAAAPAGGQLRVTITTESAHQGAGLSLSLETPVAHGATGRPHEWPSLELLLARNLVERQHGSIAVTTHTATTGAPGGGRRRVTVVIPSVTTAHLHDGAPTLRQPPPIRVADREHAAAAPDRRRIPLTIAFRERRHHVRRQEHDTIAFSDRRRPFADPARPGAPAPPG
jgi:DNA-binding NarL/FixJ family response regulator